MSTQTRGDITVRDNNRIPVLIVETKNKRGTDSTWASRMFESVLTHYVQPGTRYLLLATPDKFYLWSGENLREAREPAYEVDPTLLLRPLFERAGVNAETISHAGFELLITSLLYELLRSDQLPQSYRLDQSWLIESGLFEALKDGDMAFEEWS